MLVLFQYPLLQQQRHKLITVTTILAIKSAKMGWIAHYAHVTLDIKRI